MRAVLALVVILAAVAAPAQAQQVRAEPPATARCLMPPAAERGEPEYPFKAWKLAQRGRVLVELTFQRPDAAPRIEVLENVGDDELVDAVKAHVRTLRVPCLEAGEAPPRLKLEFVFKPDDRQVVSTAAVDPDAARREKQASCVMHVDSKQMSPDYPTRALRNETQGRILARLRFDASDKPPTAELLHRASATVLAAAVREFAQGYRMPCHEGVPVHVSILYIYRLGDSAFGFKPITLLQFLGNVKNVQLQRVDFDTHQMGCPFDVRLTYYRPHARNGVAQISNLHPGRGPFLDWLRDSELDLPSRTLDAVFADSVVLTVPCIKFNLKPKE